MFLSRLTNNNFEATIENPEKQLTCIKTIITWTVPVVALLLLGGLTCTGPTTKQRHWGCAVPGSDLHTASTCHTVKVHILNKTVYFTSTLLPVHCMVR